MQATLIQCTNSKRSEPATARDLYDESGYFRHMRAYALARDLPWFILSAKHGLLRPEERVDPYDDFGLSDEQCKEIAQDLTSMRVTDVDIIAGKKYTDPLLDHLEEHNISYEVICEGMRIGDRMSRLQTLTTKESHQDLC